GTRATTWSTPCVLRRNSTSCRSPMRALRRSASRPDRRLRTLVSIYHDGSALARTTALLRSRRLLPGTRPPALRVALAARGYSAPGVRLPGGVRHHSEHERAGL